MWRSSRVPSASRRSARRAASSSGVERGSPIIVDAETGEIYLRPTPEVIKAYADKARFRARRQRKYHALRDQPAVTRDGQRDRVC